MTKTLKISADLSLPLDAVTRTFVVYGGKGKGKTNFGSVLCEELSKADLRFCVTDPLDVWWGLQHGANKTRQGIDVVILGGKHGDIPIEPTAGAIVADFVADETVSTVIVMRRANGEMWSTGERIRFMRDFIRRLFVRQGEQRIPLMLVIDEAGRFVPQQAPKHSPDIMDCVGAIEETVEWGRNVGLGVCLITQRSARMNKSVSELAECMVAFQTAGPNSISAIVDWFGEHIPRDQQNKLIEALRKLPVGRALVVSPEWLEFEGQAQIRLRETFDSSATPKAGGNLRAPGTARKPDLDKYRERMAATIEKAIADDPKNIRKKYEAQIAELKRQLTSKAPAPAKTVETIKEVEKPVLKEAQIKRFESITEKLSTVGTQLVEVAKEITEAIKKVSTNGHQTVAQRSTLPERKAVVPRAPRELIEIGDLKINKTQQRILDALAWYESIGILEPTTIQVGAIALIDSTGGYFSNTVGPLASAGLIERRAGTMSLTDEGRSVAVIPHSIGSLDEYHDVLRQRVRKARSANGRTVDMLNAIIANGVEMSTEEIGNAVGIDHTGGYFSNTIGPLSTLGLIERNQGIVRPTDVLFPPGL